MAKHHGNKNKVLFSGGVSLNTSNYATHTHPTAPIVIERLHLPLAPSEQHEDSDSIKSFINFTALSEKRLLAAVKLAKRDLRLRSVEMISTTETSPEAVVFGKSDAELLQEDADPSKDNLRTSCPREEFVHPAQQISQKQLHNCASCRLESPAGVPGPKLQDRSNRDPLTQEMNKLHCQMDVYIHAVEDLLKRDFKITGRESLEPDEKHRLNVRRQQQGARLSRVIYGLQLQIKQIQQDAERLKSLKLWDMKKSPVIKRLAASHRGAIRVFQEVIHQLSDPHLDQMPPCYQELGQLIHKLALCSTLVGMTEGSAVAEMAFNIMLKLETFELVLCKLKTSEQAQVQTCSPQRKSPPRSTTQTTVLKGSNRSHIQGPRKPANPKRGVRGWRETSQKAKTDPRHPPHREASRRVLKKNDVPNKHNLSQDEGVQQPPVADPPSQRKSSQRGQAEHRCLLPSTTPTNLNKAGEIRAESNIDFEKENQAEEVAKRREVLSPSLWAVQDELEERTQPLFSKAQSTETVEQLIENQRKDAITETDVLSEDQYRLQAHTLESMLLRMEQIQKDQEEVRMRFTSITYSDSLYWDQSRRQGTQCFMRASRPTSPQPIRLTRPVLKQTSVAEIDLKNPVDANFQSENSLTEQQQKQKTITAFPGPEENVRRTSISIPHDMLENIRRYQQDYSTYLQVVAHKGVGFFNPWATADSLAEEIFSEALADVTTEFQNVMESYAEAVYTSEFLQPIQLLRPPASETAAAAVVSQ